MTTSDWWPIYKDLCREPIKVKRYTGQGVNRPAFSTEVRGKSRYYAATELVGTIVQGDQSVVVLAEDLIAQQFPLPVLGSDKVIVSGKELSIIAPKPRVDLNGDLVAYELQCRG